MKKIILIMIILFGCSVNPSKLGDDYVKKFVNNINCAKNTKYNLCFCVVASRRTGSTDSTGIGLTNIPCQKIGE
jgi:hypothetical protein